MTLCKISADILNVKGDVDEIKAKFCKASKRRNKKERLFCYKVVNVRKRFENNQKI